MRRSFKPISIGAASLLGFAVFAPSLAAAQITEDFSGDVSADLLYADVVNLDALAGDAPSVLQLGLAQTEAQADNGAGLGDGILTRAWGRNLDPALLDESLPLNLAEAEQTAPPDNTEPEVTELIPLGAADPLFTGAISRATAHARDPANVQCPVDGREPIAVGTVSTTNLGILNLGDFNLVSVTAAPEGGDTLATVSGIYLGADGSIISEASGTDAVVNVADELIIEVVDTTLTATATGQPGGATVDWSGAVYVDGEPIVEFFEMALGGVVLEAILGPLDEIVIDNLPDELKEGIDTLLEGLSALPFFDEPTPADTTLDDLIRDTVLTLDQLAQLLGPTARVSVGQLTSETAADGTRAYGQVDLLRLEIVVTEILTGEETPLVDLRMFPFEAEAVVPVGGIDCGLPPLTVVKDGPETVEAGESFDYTITVTNELECTATDVVVVDTITGPAGFEVTSTDPEADSVNGGVVTWNVDDDLEPGDSIVFTVTVSVPSTALPGSEFANTAVADANCDGQPLPPGTDTMTGPRVTDDDIRLPRTGGGLALLAMGALAAAGVMRRR